MFRFIDRKYGLPFYFVEQAYLILLVQFFLPLQF